MGRPHLGPTPGGWGWGLQPMGLPWDTLQRIMSPSGLPVLSQTPLVLGSIRISFYRRWSMAGSQLFPVLLFCLYSGRCHGCRPYLPLPLTTSVTYTVLAENRGASACTWCLARVPLLALEAHFLLAQHRKDLAWFLGPRETPSYAFTFCLELALLKSFYVF